MKIDGRDGEKITVVDVTKAGFKLSNGDEFEHPEPLEFVPTVEEFQEIYDRSKAFVLSLIPDEKAVNCC